MSLLVLVVELPHGGHDDEHDGADDDAGDAAEVRVRLYPMREALVLQVVQYLAAAGPVAALAGVVVVRRLGVLVRVVAGAGHRPIVVVVIF